MRNPLGGPVATLLMFVPLLAIPLFAVFGTPQMSSTGSPAAQVEELKFAVEKDKPQTGNSLPEADLVKHGADFRRKRRHSERRGTKRRAAGGPRGRVCRLGREERGGSVCRFRSPRRRR